MSKVVMLGFTTRFLTDIGFVLYFEQDQVFCVCVRYNFYILTYVVILV